MDIKTQVCHPSKRECCKLTITRDLDLGATLVENLSNCKFDNVDSTDNFDVKLENVGNPDYYWYGEKILLDGHTLCSDGVKFPGRPPKPNLRVQYTCPLKKWMYGEEKATFNCSQKN